jgi:hypothetical protein
VSDLYRMAQALKDAPDERIRLLAFERSLDLSAFADLFELAEALLSSKSQQLFLSKMTRAELEACWQIQSGKKVGKELALWLTQDLYAWSGTDLELFDWVREKIPSAKMPSVENESESAPRDNLELDLGIHGFEAVQAATEILFDVEQSRISAVGKNSLAVPDLKRISSHLGKTKEYVRSLVEMLLVAELISVENKKFFLSEKADDWLNSTFDKRWSTLAKVWLSLLGEAAAKSLSQFEVEPISSNLKDSLSYIFPLGQDSLQLARLLDVAEILGLSSNHQPGPWLGDLLSGKIEVASSEIASKFPSEQLRAIIQADLSITSPGPLPASDEIMLRKFSTAEVVGLASSYRISLKSISLGMEHGLSEGTIRGFLEKLSGQKLPQPVDYLLREAGLKFASLRVMEQDAGSKIFCRDEFLLKQISLDSSLRSLMLEQTENGLLSPVSQSESYFLLLESGYLPVRVDAKDRVLTPASLHKKASSSSEIEVDIERLKSAQLPEAATYEPSEVERKIQLALRSKSLLIIDLVAAGKPLSFVLEPIGLANGRLRARDKKADIERTLPVSSITAIEIG